MYKTNKLCLILCLVLIFTMPNTPAAAEQIYNGDTGGISLIRTGNTIIEVEGGFIRNIGKKEIFIWMLALSAKIKISHFKPLSSNETNTLNFKVANLHGPRIIVEGVDNFKSGAKEITFRVKVPPKQNKLVVITTLWQEPTFQIALMGDNRDGPQIFKKILRKSNEHNPLFLINCGDLVSNGKAEEYQDFLQYLQESDYPAFFALGNHDIPLFGRKIYNHLFGPSYFSFRYADCCFIFLDNSLGYIDEGQYLWLTALLEANKNVRKFISLHVPPIDPDPTRNYHMDLPFNTRRLLDLIDKYEVEAVFAAHLHGYAETKAGKTKYIITGGAGAPLRGANSFFHYVLITVTPTGIKHQVIKVQ